MTIKLFRNLEILHFLGVKSEFYHSREKSHILGVLLAIVFLMLCQIYIGGTNMPSIKISLGTKYSCNHGSKRDEICP